MPVKEVREFRPELISRRGEAMAWVFALVIALCLVVLHWRFGAIPTTAWVFWGFLLFAGLSISLGNWIDRHTLIYIDSRSVTFENGLRRTKLDWFDIQKVNVLPTHWGKSIQVIGETSHFEFRTMGEVQFQGEVRGRVGFAAGQEILDQIIRASELQLASKTDNALS